MQIPEPSKDTCLAVLRLILNFYARLLIIFLIFKLSQPPSCENSKSFSMNLLIQEESLFIARISPFLSNLWIFDNFHCRVKFRDCGLSLFISQDVHAYDGDGKP